MPKKKSFCATHTQPRRNSWFIFLKSLFSARILERTYTTRVSLCLSPFSRHLAYATVSDTENTYSRLRGGSFNFHRGALVFLIASSVSNYAHDEMRSFTCLSDSVPTNTRPMIEEASSKIPVSFLLFIWSFLKNEMLSKPDEFDGLKLHNISFPGRIAFQMNNRSQTLPEKGLDAVNQPWSH